MSTQLLEAKQKNLLSLSENKIPSTESFDFEIIATVTQWLIPEVPEIVQSNASVTET